MSRMYFRAIAVSAAVVMTLLVVSCDPAAKMEKQEKEEIEEYLSQNSNIHYVRQSSGLYYHEVVAGTGISPDQGDSAWVKYTGMYLDGTVFDSNVGTGSLYDFIVGENITGFDEGVTLMKVGGKSSLLIPSKLGYGSSGTYGGIGGYTPLLFDLELIKVVPQTAK